MPVSEQHLNHSFQHPEAVMNAVDSGFGGEKAVVIGDLMLDHHVWGGVNRISPEAPVPVVRFQKETFMAGGSGNVALNLVGLGMKVSLISLVGADEAAMRVRSTLEKAGISTHGILTDESRPTTTKMRILGGHQQMLRLDSESTNSPSPELEERLLSSFRKELEGAKVVVISDYAKGILSPSLCRSAIQLAKQASVPVLVDPKGSDWEKYRGATSITPNRSEISTVARQSLSDYEQLVAVATELREKLELEALTVTLSEDGMLHLEDVPIRVPAMAREVFDVSGAGDTAIATLAAAWAYGLSRRDSLVLANVASGIVVGKVGTVALNASELSAELESSEGNGLRGKSMGWLEAKRLVDSWKRRGESIVFTNGCFDILHAGHVTYLGKARQLGHRLVVGLNSDESVRRLKGPTRPINPLNQRSTVLSGLACADLVVAFEEDTPLELIKHLKPDVLAKGADYSLESVVGGKEVLEWGGSVKLVELVDGLSTTKIAAKIAEGAL